MNWSGRIQLFHVCLNWRNWISANWVVKCLTLLQIKCFLNLVSPYSVFQEKVTFVRDGFGSWWQVYRLSRSHVTTMNGLRLQHSRGICKYPQLLLSGTEWIKKSVDRNGWQTKRSMDHWLPFFFPKWIDLPAPRRTHSLSSQDRAGYCSRNEAQRPMYLQAEIRKHTKQQDGKPQRQTRTLLHVSHVCFSSVCTVQIVWA